MSWKVGYKSIEYNEIRPGDLAVSTNPLRSENNNDLSTNGTDFKIYVISRVILGEIHLDQDKNVIIFRKDNAFHEGRWIIEDIPDNIISFVRAPAVDL